MDSNGWADIGYNFIVGEDGNIYEGTSILFFKGNIKINP